MLQWNKEQNMLQKSLRFFEPVKSNKLVTLWFILYFCIEWFFWILFVYFVKDITNALEIQNIDIFHQVLVEYAVYFIILFIFLAIAHNWWTYTYNRFRKTIEGEYFPIYVKFDMNTHEKYGTWKSISIISKWVKLWWGLLDKIIIEGVNLTLSVWLTVVLLSQVNYLLVVLFIFLLILWQVLWLMLNYKVLELRKSRIELDNLWSKRVVKIIMAKNEILQAEKIGSEIKKLHELQEWQIFYNKKMAPYMVPFFALGVIVVIILFYTIFLYFWKLYFAWEISLSLIVWITWAILMMQKVFTNTLDFLKNFTKEFAEIQVLWDFFDSTPQIEWYEEWNTFEHTQWAIELQNINFGYDENNLVFHRFSLKLMWEKVTAFVGPSGGWKSTLVKLIAGYIRANSWEIIVDGQKLSETSLKSYFKDIGYLTQEPSVFDGTVRENLMYAVNEEIDETHIRHIIKQAHAEFVYDLPLWLDTEIGERWVKLSWGQKQRLAIAKIFLKNPKIIILDEPTSALDSISEKHITLAMQNLFKDRTVLVIAHRLQTVKHADDIIVIENSELKERGTHKELVKMKWFYNEMLELQSWF